MSTTRSVELLGVSIAESKAHAGMAFAATNEEKPRIRVRRRGNQRLLEIQRSLNPEKLSFDILGSTTLDFPK